MRRAWIRGVWHLTTGLPCEGGSFAEYARVPQHKLALKPVNLSYEAAAAVPISAVTALQALRDKGQVQPGQRVLIIGAAGGVGTFAVQLAKAFGDRSQVCVVRQRSSWCDRLALTRLSTTPAKTSGRVRSITTSSWTAPVFVPCHTCGGHSPAKEPSSSSEVRAADACWVALAEPLRAALISPFVSQTLRGMVGTDRKEDLEFLAELIEAGKVSPVIDRTYPLSGAAEAIRYLAEGRARGKIVITV